MKNKRNLSNFLKPNQFQLYMYSGTPSERPL